MFNRILLALTLAGSMLAVTAPAEATSFCNLRKTSDGFVALRAGPSADSRMVGRMRSTDEVMLGEGEQGQWIEVTWWRGNDRLTKGFEKSAGKGWVNRRLVSEECG